MAQAENTMTFKREETKAVVYFKVEVKKTRVSESIVTIVSNSPGMLVVEEETDSLFSFPSDLSLCPSTR